MTHKLIPYSVMAFTALAMTVSPALAELPARFNQQAWAERAQLLIAAANDTTTDPDAYIGGLIPTVIKNDRWYSRFSQLKRRLARRTSGGAQSRLPTAIGQSQSPLVLNPLAPGLPAI